MVDHGNGISTLYAHCSAVYVSVGQSVSAGETIASVGSTGWSTGNHCHFEVRVNGSTVDPTGYLY
jgi:murein DD-endopeptidase MepM/ murein hydrolase activator NlpD